MPRGTEKSTQSADQNHAGGGSEKPGTQDEINFYCLARPNRECPSGRSGTVLRATLHIEDVIAGRKRYSIMSIGVSSESFDFLLSVRAQNHQRIFRIVGHFGLRIVISPNVVVTKFNSREGNDLQISFYKTWSLSADQAAGGQQENASSSESRQ